MKIKEAYKNYIENSEGIDDYAKELMYAYKARIVELEKQNKELTIFPTNLLVRLDRIIKIEEHPEFKQIDKWIAKGFNIAIKEIRKEIEEILKRGE